MRNRAWHSLAIGVMGAVFGNLSCGSNEGRTERCACIGELPNGSFLDAECGEIFCYQGDFLECGEDGHAYPTGESCKGGDGDADTDADTDADADGDPNVDPDWTCDAGWWSAGDGCDCGCGASDPDCRNGGCVTPGCRASDCNFCWVNGVDEGCLNPEPECRNDTDCGLNQFCNGNGECQNDPVEGPCTGVDDGSAISHGNWGACGSFSDDCDESGTQWRTARICRNGQPVDEKESQACSRDTDNQVVWAGPIGDCEYMSGCDEDAVAWQDIQVCRNGDTVDSVDSVPCNRDTDGNVSNGAWGACGSYADTCDESGTQSRTNSVCVNGSAQNQPESRACTRDTDGIVVSNGVWDACTNFVDTCDETGTHRRFNRVCVAGATVDQEERVNCSRDTDGVNCGGEFVCSVGVCECPFQADIYEPNESRDAAYELSWNFDTCWGAMDIDATRHQAGDGDWYRWETEAGICGSDPWIQVTAGFTIRFEAQCYVGDIEGGTVGIDGDSCAIDPFDSSRVICNANDDIYVEPVRCPDQADPEVVMAWLRVSGGDGCDAYHIEIDE